MQLSPIAGSFIQAGLLTPGSSYLPAFPEFPPVALSAFVPVTAAGPFPIWISPHGIPYYALRHLNYFLCFILNAIKLASSIFIYQIACEFLIVLAMLLSAFLTCEEISAASGRWPDSSACRLRSNIPTSRLLIAS